MGSVHGLFSGAILPPRRPQSCTILDHPLVIIITLCRTYFGHRPRLGQQHARRLPNLPVDTQTSDHSLKLVAHAQNVPYHRLAPIPHFSHTRFLRLRHDGSRQELLKSLDGGDGHSARIRTILRCLLHLLYPGDLQGFRQAMGT